MSNQWTRASSDALRHITGQNTSNEQLNATMQMSLLLQSMTSINCKPCGLQILHGTRSTLQQSDTAGVRQGSCPIQVLPSLCPNLQFQSHHCFTHPLTIKILLRQSKMNSDML